LKTRVINALEGNPDQITTDAATVLTSTLTPNELNYLENLDWRLLENGGLFVDPISRKAITALMPIVRGKNLQARQLKNRALGTGVAYAQGHICSTAENVAALVVGAFESAATTAISFTCIGAAVATGGAGAMACLGAGIVSAAIIIANANCDVNDPDLPPQGDPVDPPLTCTLCVRGWCNGVLANCGPDDTDTDTSVATTTSYTTSSESNTDTDAGIGTGTGTVIDTVSDTGKGSATGTGTATSILTSTSSTTSSESSTGTTTNSVTGTGTGVKTATNTKTATTKTETNIKTNTATSSVTSLGGCGDGILQDGEQCDDGNTDSGDGCSSSCQIEICFRCPEPPGQPCIDYCQCGNGILDPYETCDDGNTISGDGCSGDCQTLE
jgi:cysteine-rich repeat protein